MARTVLARMGRRYRLLLPTSLLAALPWPGPRRRAAGYSTIVRGIQHEAGSCRDGGHPMTGDLEGCWWVDTFVSNTDPDQSHFLAYGDERFEAGMAMSGRMFSSTYVYTAKTDGPWPSSVENPTAGVITP